MERAWSLVVDDDRRVFMDEGPALEISDDVDSANKHPCAAHSAAQESIATGSLYRGKRGCAASRRSSFHFCTVLDVFYSTSSRPRLDLNLRLGIEIPKVVGHGRSLLFDTGVSLSLAGQHWWVREGRHTPLVPCLLRTVLVLCTCKHRGSDT